MSGMTNAGLFRSDLRAGVFLLAAILIHNLLYPLSGADGVGPAVFYAFFSTIFVVAVFAMSRSRAARAAILLSGGAVLATGLANSYAPSAATALALYLSVVAYHGVLIAVLVRVIFVAEHVFTEVVLAATSLYLLIGTAFTALYGLVEWALPGSFVSASGAPIDWQQFLYFSYVTLTSLGYGDILPVGFYAQSLASFEAVGGVLYTVILLSRLVGMHTSRRTP